MTTATAADVLQAKDRRPIWGTLTDSTTPDNHFALFVMIYGTRFVFLCYGQWPDRKAPIRGYLLRAGRHTTLSYHSTTLGGGTYLGCNLPSRDAFLRMAV